MVVAMIRRALLIAYLLDSGQSWPRPARYSRQLLTTPRVFVARHPQRRVLVRHGLLYSLATSMLILFAGGFGLWVRDPRVLTLSDGL